MSQIRTNRALQIVARRRACGFHGRRPQGPRIAVATIAIATLGLISCEQPVQKPEQADAVARKWIAAAVSKDGQTYCELMTPALLQTVTHKSGAAARKTCEKHVTAGTGEYPFQFAIPKPRVAGPTDAQVSASGKKLRGHITLTQQKGKLLIDTVR
ncbi:MAG TPA: hypothetical protein VF526_16280 [Solirubrobacteraceae bacterium]|jgi:hypothetical protein